MQKKIFLKTSDFHTVVDSMDGIPINATVKLENIYVNQKGLYSINVKLVSDSIWVFGQLISARGL